MLSDPTTLTVFLAAALLLLTLGPAVLFIVARSIDQGRAAGLVSSLGMGVGRCFTLQQRYFAGTVYILLGVATVFSGADNK